MPLKGLIIYNGFLTSPAFIDFAIQLKNAGKKRKHHMTIKTNDDLLNVLSGSKTQTEAKAYDYVLFTDKDIYLARNLERAGLPVFNRPEAIEISDDKIRTYLTLAEKGLPIPKTYIAPLTFGQTLTKEDTYVKKVVKALGYPFIIKEAFGSFGEQVYLIHQEEELEACLQQIAGKPFLFQEFIHSSYGKDLRLQVVGGEVVAAMKRSANNDFRANVTNGARMEAYKPSRKERDLAIKAVKAIGADFAGVDLLFGEGNERYVCEVNSNAHIRNLQEATSIDVAPFIIEHIEKKIRREKICRDG